MLIANKQHRKKERTVAMLMMDGPQTVAPDDLQPNKLLWATSCGAKDCDSSGYVLAEYQIDAIDWSLVAEGLKTLRAAGVIAPTHAVSRALTIHFDQSLLDGDQLIIRGGLTGVGATSLTCSSRQLAFRKGMMVEIGSAKMTMVAYHNQEKRKVEHGIPAFQTTLPCFPQRAVIAPSQMDEPVLVARIGCEHQNHLGAIFGGTIVGQALQASKMLAERLIFTEDEIPTRQQSQQRLIPKSLEIEFNQPGRVHASIFGYAQLRNRNGSEMQIDVQLLQYGDNRELEPIAHAHVVLRSVSKDLFGLH